MARRFLELDFSNDKDSENIRDSMFEEIFED